MSLLNSQLPIDRIPTPMSTPPAISTEKKVDRRARIFEQTEVPIVTPRCDTPLVAGTHVEFVDSFNFLRQGCVEMTEHNILSVFTYAKPHVVGVQNADPRELYQTLEYLCIAPTAITRVLTVNHFLERSEDSDFYFQSHYDIETHTVHPLLQWSTPKRLYQTAKVANIPHDQNYAWTMKQVAKEVREHLRKRCACLLSFGLVFSSCTHTSSHFQGQESQAAQVCHHQEDPFWLLLSPRHPP